jgi:hypothetical protein
MVRLDPRMASLRGQHAREIGRLFREFLKLHPSIDPDLDEDTWTEKQTEAWREFTAEEDAKFNKA